LGSLQTEEELENFKANMTSSIIKGITPRKILESLKSALPRMGGPGRSHILDAKEKGLACREILREIANDKSPKEAIKSVSHNFQKLFGKTISSRTLESIWSERSKWLRGLEPDTSI
jgi:hypothetical protein